ncbi:fungal-specific transcription factor domain-containing protein [Ilyonectria robusta]|uniref:fungal-specific transcription factor domain-containing protein n=1 Tax=Ilyonectria robusta TaxID=1079257 RepID=UPI001E8CF9A6|nr:fungal-specific transcription factor domain-containing protein [Ilyonectria robusta]KAH8733446.1 fungal-specific transcription factor domain-containing protein [Ilyonectria robusta]
MAAEASEGSAAPPSPASTSAKTITDRNLKKRASPDDDSEAPQKVTKRRAARACVSCRARKVRCDVVEGAPCGNCRWDNVECVVQESRRRKKNHLTASTVGQAAPTEAQLRCKTASNNPLAISTADLRRPSSGSAISTSSIDGPSSFLNNSGLDNHVPHMIYQRSGYRHDPVLLNKLHSTEGSSQRVGWSNLMTTASVFDNLRTSQFINSVEEADNTSISSSSNNNNNSSKLPAFLRPLPTKIAAEDVKYLHIKGALSLPTLPLQNALLQAYVEFVHPYMPLMDLNHFLGTINTRDGRNGQTSLFLYQAVMFAASAFVDMKYLREGGYTTRKAARKSFFQKTRLLYDFDYESDRLILVQALLLMTYWYETPDDQKDTWHWMGVAISLAHTIGLHRNPGSTSMTPAKQKLWKRIWWSCFMRDRLIALGMRRPTRIKDEDFDVPMLEESDFEIEVLPEDNTVIPASCTLVRDVDMQRELAIMCIAKAQLCVCISHMLKAQYSVLIRDKMKPENTTNSTMMLFPNKQLDNVESVTEVDHELMAWAESLPTCCQFRTLTPLDVKDGRSTIAVQRTLLHMVYYTTISALHRPQFLPSSPLQAPTTSRQVQDMSRLRVRDAAMHITRMATELHQCRLERFLPTTGVTVILPAMIIHLLEMKNPAPQSRERATRGFRQCMRVMEKLREVYAAADYATGFLDAALRKAAIDINANIAPSTIAMMKRVPVEFSAQTPPPENAPYMTASESLFNERPKKEPQPTPTPTPTRMMPPNTVNAAALELSTNSPPQTELESPGAGITPSASGASEEIQLDVEQMDLDFMQGHDEFDWNAVAGTDFDVDQWLQFPPEGVANQDENLIAGVLGRGVDEPPTMSAEQALNWAMSAEVDPNAMTEILTRG